MPDMSPQMTAVVVGLIGSVLGIVVASFKMRSDFFKEVKDFYDRELGSVRKDVQDMHTNLIMTESRMEKKLERDLAAVKESQESEMRNLRRTIEELRSEVRNSHSKLIDLLSTIVQKN